jgi:type VI secretion system (T6SS) baseplate-like injector VgrG
MSSEKLIANLTQKVDGRYYGKYRGLVVDNQDPEHLARLRVRVPRVLGPEVVTGWAMPCVQYGGDRNQGFVCIPDAGAAVWVEFEAGDLEFPIWVGTFWSKPGGESELPKGNRGDGAEADSFQSPPTRKIFKTKAGHTIQFEDADGEERILICDGQNENRIVFGASGMSIVSRGGISANGGERVCLEGLIGWLANHQHTSAAGVCQLSPQDLAKLAALGASSNAPILSEHVTLG